jgi:hypothetical protein
MSSTRYAPWRASEGGAYAWRVKTILLVAVSVCALAFAAVAPATIVPQHGIGGARLGMSQTAVQARLGLPLTIHKGTNEIGTYTTYLYPTLLITFFGGSKVTSIATHSAKQRTSRGVGVGTTRAGVAAKVAAATCVTESGHEHCYVGKFLPGQTVTDFTIKNGRVTRITVGYVID